MHPLEPFSPRKVSRVFKTRGQDEFSVFLKVPKRQKIAGDLDMKSPAIFERPGVNGNKKNTLNKLQRLHENPKNRKPTISNQQQFKTSEDPNGCTKSLTSETRERPRSAPHPVHTHSHKEPNGCTKSLKSEFGRQEFYKTRYRNRSNGCTKSLLSDREVTICLPLEFL